MRDARADLLSQEYLNKAKEADSKHNQVPEDSRTSPKKTFGTRRGQRNCGWKLQRGVRGHSRLCGSPRHLQSQGGWRVKGEEKGHLRTEEGEMPLAISALRRRLGLQTVRCQWAGLRALGL